MENPNRIVLDELFENRRIAIRRSSLFDRPPTASKVPFDWDRVEGMMLGLAVGDALGATTEGDLPATRRAQFGEIVGHLKPGLTRRHPGRPTDDTQMAFWTLEQMIADRGFVPEHVADCFCQGWIHGIGSSVHEFIRRRKDRKLKWQEAGVKSAGNGALMRIAPMVMPHLRTASSELWVDTALCAMLTHNDSASIASCLAFVSMLWDLLTMEQTPACGWWVDRFVETARELEIDDSYSVRGAPAGPYRGFSWQFVAEQLPAAEERGWSTLEACNHWWSGAYLLETIPSVLYILSRHAGDSRAAILRAVNDTKDNDTVAAIVGAAVGALHGRRAISSEWIDGLSGRTRDHDRDGRILELLEKSRNLWG